MESTCVPAWQVRSYALCALPCCELALRQSMFMYVEREREIALCRPCVRSLLSLELCRLCATLSHVSGFSPPISPGYIAHTRYGLRPKLSRPCVSLVSGLRAARLARGALASRSRVSCLYLLIFHRRLWTQATIRSRYGLQYAPQDTRHVRNAPSRHTVHQSTHMCDRRPVFLRARVRIRACERFET